MFRDMPIDTMAPNFLVARIQPEECISLQFNAKVPGPAVVLDGVGMTFRYKDYFDAKPSTGYETLIYDCMIGDAILFQRADGIEAGWRVVEPFLKAWKRENANGLKLYKAGTSGPKAADDLIERDGREWRPIT
jgi:glucose-6-phosphate 1-dehydrogenase